MHAIFRYFLRLNLWLHDEQFGTKEKCPGVGGAQYAKIDPRLICLICVCSVSKAQLAKYQKRTN